MKAQLSEQYLKHQKQLVEAQSKFDSNPCKKTATNLTRIKEIKFGNAERYTKEYFEWMVADNKKTQKNWMIEIVETANMCKIEDDFKKGVINNDIRMVLHNNNEQRAEQLRIK
jgi:hypothetical protein